MNRRRLNPRLKIQMVGLLMLLGMAALGFKLWWIQVAHGTEWTAQIRGSSQVTVRIPSVRGEIKDRNGLTLVSNRASYEVDFYLPDMVRGYKQMYPDKKIPNVTYRGTVRNMARDKSEADIVTIVNDAVQPRLQRLDLAVSINAKDLQRHYRNDTLVPFTYREELDPETLARFSEHDVGLSGVELAIRPVRRDVD